MKTGRNAPCPCGSGKKYKKCCMEKDQAAERVQQEAQRTGNLPATSPQAPPSDIVAETPTTSDSEMEAWNERYQTFESGDYETRIALFHQTMEEGNLMDGEMAFEMLNMLHPQAVEHEEWERFDALVAVLRECLPEIYDEEAHYLLDWGIDSALATGREGNLKKRTLDLAGIADRDIDLFNRIIDKLAYHGRIDILVSTVRTAWPHVKDAGGIIPYGIFEFAHQATQFEIFSYVAQTPASDMQISALQNRLDFYEEADPKRVERYVAHLTGQVGRSWSLSDFDLESLKKTASREEEGDLFDEEWEEEEEPDEEPGRQNLLDFTATFLGYLCREKGVSYTRGELARNCINEYILQRVDGDLDEYESLLDAAMQGRNKPKLKRRFVPRKPEHVLMPDYATLDHYVAKLLNFINPQHYKAAAIVEMTPHWLDFLQRHNFIDDTQRQQRLRRLSDLAEPLMKIFKQSGDPALYQGIESWRKGIEGSISAFNQ